MSLRVIKLKNAIVMNIIFLFIGSFITLNLKSVSPEDLSFASSSSGDIDVSVKFVNVILTAPQNAERRAAIRNTWLRLVDNVTYSSFQKPKDWFRHYFVVGLGNLDEKTIKELREEQSINGDMMFLELADGYRVLTRKMLESIRQIDRRFENLLYLIKCDDDSFVRIDLLVEELMKRDRKLLTTISMDKTYRKHLYWGYFKGNSHVRSGGKWAETDWFLCDRYLPYAMGGGYVISSDIISFIAKNADMLHLYKSEDVAVGVWTSALSNVHRLHDSRFDTEWTSRGCDNSLLVRHKQSPADMFEMYDNLVKSKGLKLCSEVHFTRMPYKYNWNVLPSMCCSNTNENGNE